MATATTTKPVNLYQLALEVGGDPSFHAVGPLEEDGPDKTIDSPDVADLQTAVDAHEADWTIVPPVSDEEQERQDAANKLDELRAKGWANLTSSEKGDLVRLFFHVT